MGKHLVFVYGTLKRGFTRSQFLRDQRYLGIARTEPKYGMYAYGGFPALIGGEDQTNHIYGEIYEVDDSCMIELDRVEGVDRGLFERKEIDLNTLTLASLPVTENVWNSIARKSAHAYFFKGDLNGAGNCGPLWVQK